MDFSELSAQNIAIFYIKMKLYYIIVLDSTKEISILMKHLSPSYRSLPALLTILPNGGTRRKWSKSVLVVNVLFHTVLNDNNMKLY